MGIAGVTLLASFQVAAQASLPPQLVHADWLKPPFRHAVVARGDMPIRAMDPMATARRETQSDITAHAQRLFDQNAAIGLLLLDQDGSVLFEAYKQGATADSRMIGYSMSKTATSVAMGQALCDGLVRSLDDPAEIYAEVLKGTAYGRATIKQLLTMSSGGKKPLVAGQAVEGFTTALLRHQTTTIRQGFKTFGEGGGDASTPDRFEYKGYDTYALGAVIAAVSKKSFPEYFSQAVWQRIGAEADAAWLVDREGDAATAEGFGARVRDWARLAMYVRDRVASATGDDACMNRYLREATTARISNGSGRVGNHFRSYGYQIWMDNWAVRAPAFWMLGYGGQRIGVDPVSGRVLVLISSVEDFMPEVYRLFDRWTRP